MATVATQKTSWKTQKSMAGSVPIACSMTPFEPKWDASPTKAPSPPYAYTTAKPQHCLEDRKRLTNE
jgi:hypothetical protein